MRVSSAWRINQSTDVESSIVHVSHTNPAFISSSSEAAAETDAAFNSCRILSGGSGAVSAVDVCVCVCVCDLAGSEWTGSASPVQCIAGPARSEPRLQPVASVIYQRSICFDSRSSLSAHFGTILWSSYWDNLAFNPLECKGNYSATSNNMKLVHWPLMGGLVHLVQRGRDLAGYQPAQAPPRLLLQF